jgi:hypothetical protein
MKIHKNKPCLLGWGPHQEAQALKPRLIGFWERLIGFWERLIGFWERPIGFYERLIGFWERPIGFWEQPICLNKEYGGLVHHAS